MSAYRITGIHFDQWPPIPGDMHFNEGGKEHLIESDYEYAAVYGREVGENFRRSELSLARTLSTVATAITEAGLDENPNFQQGAFFKGIVEVGYVVPLERGEQQ
jgi:hypothetical protein